MATAEFDAWVERARAVPIESEIARRGVALRRSGAERIGPCPRCGGVDRFSINIKENVWNCRQCKPENIAGDIIGLVEWLDGCEFVRACETLNQEPPPLNGHAETGNGQGSREVAWYDYVDEVGALLFQVVRFEPKDFRQRKPNVNGGSGWDWSTKGVRQVPFQLPELIEGIALEHIVYVVEGEKDVLTLAKLGLTATCNAMGAGNWRSSLNQYFKDADVVIIADHDPQTTNKKTGEKLFHPDGRPKFAGFDHAMQVAAELKPIAYNVRMFDIAELWPACGPKGDITDYIEAGGSVEALIEFVARCESWTPAKAKDKAPAATSVPVVFPFPIHEEAIPLRDWVVPGLLMRRHVTVLVAPSGSGKSLLTLQLGIACAQGRNWSGWIPRRKFRVMVINSEDDIDEMRRRLAAAARVMEVDQVAIRNSIALVDNSNSGAVVAKFDARTKTLVRQPLVDQLVETILANEIDIVFVDPFAETFEGDENSNSELKWAGVIWREVARRTNAAVCLVHHTKKYATGMAGDVDAARGAGALIGIARIVSTLFPMTAREAETMGIAEDKRGFYLRYDDAKANLNIKSPFARWFFKQTITLDNKTAELPGDDVGVLIPWKPVGPSVLEAQIIAFFKRVDQGVLDQNGQPTGEFYSFGNRAAERSVVEFAMEFFQIEARGSAEKLIEGWRKDHRLEQVQYRSPRQRKTRARAISELDPNAPKHKAAAAVPLEEQEQFKL